jgi:hypothetical protein
MVFIEVNFLKREFPGIFPISLENNIDVKIIGFVPSIVRLSAGVRIILQHAHIFSSLQVYELYSFGI